MRTMIVSAKDRSGACGIRRQPSSTCPGGTACCRYAIPYTPNSAFVAEGFSSMTHRRTDSVFSSKSRKGSHRCDNPEFTR